MTETTATKDWFSLLYDEFHARGEVMFAFSKKQVEEAFEGDIAVTYEQVQKEWASLGAGLIVKKAALKEFVTRMRQDEDAWEAKQPMVRVRHIGTDYWDRALYKVVSHAEGAPVRVGQTLCDVALLPVGEARYLHNMTSEGEPIGQLDIHVVHVPKEG
jgi:hypothetical protein